ncbi:MAG: DUF1801 domain-containing protein [Roseibacillus sp.]
MKCPTTVKTPEEYLEWVPRERRKDISRVHQAIRKAAPALKPAIAYGMIGYGPYETKSGSEGEWFLVGLAVQKNNFALYLSACDDEGYLVEKHANDLGKVNCGKSCVRFKKLEDLDLSFAMKLVKQAVKISKK